jgi:hypothetical protein
MSPGMLPRAFRDSFSRFTFIMSGRPKLHRGTCPPRVQHQARAARGPHREERHLREPRRVVGEELPAKGRSPTEVLFLKKHTRNTLGPLRVHEVTSGVIEGLLVRKEALGPDGKPQLAAKSINSLREIIGRVFNKAIEQELWKGPNPVDKVPRRSDARRPPLRGRRERPISRR